LAVSGLIFILKVFRKISVASSCLCSLPVSFVELFDDWALIPKAAMTLNIITRVNLPTSHLASLLMFLFKKIKSEFGIILNYLSLDDIIQPNLLTGASL
jgi:hypothetical protein